MAPTTTKPPIGKLESLLGIPSTELAYAANAMSVIGGIASVVGFFATRSENRKIMGKLEDIQRYMKVLDEKISHSIKQNEEIIKKIDELPNKIEKIVDEIVGIHLLEERYSTLDSIRNNYFLLNPEEKNRYRINSTGWDRISESLTYLSNNENRLSRIVVLLQWYEFALIVTEGRAIRVIRNLAFGKGGMIVPLFQALRDELRTTHNNLLTLLTSQYVASHNLSDNLDNLDDLNFTLVNDRSEGRDVWTIDCPGGQMINGGCRESVSWRSNKQGIAFNKRKAQIPNEISQLKGKLSENVTGYCAARDAILMLLSYFDLLADDAIEFTSLHLDTTVAKNFVISSNDTQFVPMSE